MPANKNLVKRMERKNHLFGELSRGIAADVPMVSRSRPTARLGDFSDCKSADERQNAMREKRCHNIAGYCGAYSACMVSQEWIWGIRDG